MNARSRPARPSEQGFVERTQGPYNIKSGLKLILDAWTIN
jgi:hypothetical protein